MSGDYSRDSFDALRDFASVSWQQGRPTTDSELNELAAIIERRIRAGTVDTIGRAVVPRETIDGFRIDTTDDGSIEIGPGRKYLHGLLFECHGDANFDGDSPGPDPVFDRGDTTDVDGSDTTPLGVLDELVAPRGNGFLPYERQPYWPVPAEIVPDDGPHLAYLVGWQREVTAVHDPALLEPALGGIDTTTRHQNVWQVRMLSGISPNATCQTPDALIGGGSTEWADLIAPSTARLTTDTIDIEDPEDPCLIPPTDGYTGLENQLYRVEIHATGDDQGDARFKFSRENASVIAAIENFASPADAVTVQRIGRDEILRFSPGDWVEITDDIREFEHQSGQMLRVAVVDQDTRTIEFEGTIDAGLVPAGAGGDTSQSRHSRIIRWDQRSVIRNADGDEITNLDAAASDGLIPVPADGEAIVLESGITVSFSTAEGRGSYREMDHWRFAARTAGTQIERLSDAPPDGVQRHYCRLAVVRFPNSVLDCRVLWPPEITDAEAESCGCTVCVTAESHNSGALTIQAAIDQIGPEGGTVCLDGGSYVLDSSVTIDDRRAITIKGQGMGTTLSFVGGGSAIEISQSLEIEIHDLSIVSATTANLGDVVGVGCLNSGLVSLKRLAIAVAALEGASGHGVAINGLALGNIIEQSVIVAPVAVGSPSATRDNQDDDGPGFLAVAELRVDDNILFGARAAVEMSGVAINLSAAHFTRNLILGDQNGIDVNWIEPPTGSTSIESSNIISNGDAVSVGVNDLRVLDNDITGGAEAGDGIRIVSNLLADTEMDAQIVGNRIGDLANVGVGVDAVVGSLLIKRNVIRRCGTAGIAIDESAAVRHLAIDNNVIEDVADAAESVSGAAIALTQVEGGQVVGNQIKGVGVEANSPGSFAGIAMVGVGDITVETNAITEIGTPSVTASTAVGILAYRPYDGLIVRSNRILGAPDASTPAAPVWMAIAMSDPPDQTGTRPRAGSESVAGALTFVPAQVDFFEVGGERFVLTSDRLRALRSSTSPQLTVSGNQCRNAGTQVLPLVSISEPRNGSVVFSENQCQLESPSAPNALVSIVAERVIAANNVVRGRSRSDAMVINVGDGGQATVLGNLTFGGIRVEPNGLNSPFAELNLLSP